MKLDHLGYHEAWIGEHFSSEWENIPALDLFTPIHLLIGEEDYRVLLMTIEGYMVSVRATFPGEPPATPKRGASVTYTYDYFDYNEPVTIELPKGFE